MVSAVRIHALGALSCTLLCIGGCGGDDMGASSAPGSISINLTDAPVDGASEVIVVFTGIELHQAGGTTTTIDFSTPKSIDLIKLCGRPTPLAPPPSRRIRRERIRRVTGIRFHEMNHGCGAGASVTS